MHKLKLSWNFYPGTWLLGGVGVRGSLSEDEYQNEKWHYGLICYI